MAADGEKHLRHGLIPAKSLDGDVERDQKGRKGRADAKLSRVAGTKRQQPEAVSVSDDESESRREGQCNKRIKK